MSVAELQNAMLEMPQVDCPVTNHFSDGLYARELFIPKGVTIVGATHKTKHLMMVASGECMMGEKYVKAPFITETQPGTKRAIHAINDTIIITFHVTEETDIEKIGDTILEDENVKLPGWKCKALEGL